MRRRAGFLLLLTVGGLVALAIAMASGTSGASLKPVATLKPHDQAPSPCSSRDTSPHNPANPLDTPNFTGTDPLAGANLFVDGVWPFGSDAANAINQLVGLPKPTFRSTPELYSQFIAKVNAMNLSPTVRAQVDNLEKIAQAPTPHQFSQFGKGNSGSQGSGAVISEQIQNYLCRMQGEDPTAVGVITTYFVNHGGGCNAGNQPKFKQEVQAVKHAVGNFRVVIFIEEDGIDTICFTSRKAVKGRIALLKYEIDQLSTLPHAVEYVEGGTADANSAKNSARVLNKADARKIRGFFLGDTHFNWAYKEIQFGNKVSRLTHGLHFVVDTRADGNGPKKTRNAVKQGNEVLCNPPGRALGPPPSATNGSNYGMTSSHLDGFVWVTTPGESSAKTCKNDPGQTFAASGIFDPNIAIGFASRAANRIGPQPRFPILPYP